MKIIDAQGKTIPLLFLDTVRLVPSHTAQLHRDGRSDYKITTYATLEKEVATCAAGFSSIGIQRGQPVGVISDNRKEWLITDLAILGIGGISVPRGTDSLPQELSFILSFTEVVTCVVENETQLKKVLSVHTTIPTLKNIIVMDPDWENHEDPLSGITLYPLRTIIQRGKDVMASSPDFYVREAAQGKADDTSAIIFTSGTTGEPKGVMLSHAGFIHQTDAIKAKLRCTTKDTWLCVLPVWHAFERIMQYVAIRRGSILAYSKPVGRIMAADFLAAKPTWFAAVPRIWDALQHIVVTKATSTGGLRAFIFKAGIHIATSHVHLGDFVFGRVPRFQPRSRLFDFLIAVFPWLILLPFRGLSWLIVIRSIRQRFGGKLRAGISGGGALPETVDLFWRALGIHLLEGYGLTESGPVISVRTDWAIVPGTVGKPLPGTEIRVVAEDGKTLEPGNVGILHVRGKQVMKGYYKKPIKTREVLDGQGWLDTGDLVIESFDGEIKIVGRAKDTIVLLGGENVEPSPIEARLRESPFVDHVVVVGQDKKYLGALIVPRFDRLAERFGPLEESEGHTTLLQKPEVIALFRHEIDRLLSADAGFRIFERVARFKLLSRAFEPGKELSGKQDIKRPYVADVYRKDIDSLFGDA